MNFINITPEELEGLEAFFKSITIPTELKLNGAITYKDLPKFVSVNLTLLKKGDLKGLSATVRFNDLMDLKQALEEKMVKN